MRNYQRYLRRCERLRMRRKAKRMHLKKNGYPDVPKAYRKDTANEIGLMAAIIGAMMAAKSHVKQHKKPEHIHQDKKGS